MNISTLLPTATNEVEFGSNKVPSDFPLSESMKKILDKSERLTEMGRKKLIRLIEKDVTTEDLSKAFKVTDTVLGRQTIKSQTSSAYGREMSPMNITEKRTQFYVKKNFESNLKPSYLQNKMDRGRRLAVQMRELKLKRIKDTNRVMHKCSVDIQDRIWCNSLVERAFANRPSEQDLLLTTLIPKDLSHRSRSEKSGNPVETSGLKSTHRSRDVQERMASLLTRLDQAKAVLNERKEELGPNRLTSKSRDIIDAE